MLAHNLGHLLHLQIQLQRGLLVANVQLEDRGDAGDGDTAAEGPAGRGRQGREAPGGQAGEHGCASKARTALALGVKLGDEGSQSFCSAERREASALTYM